MQSDQYNCLKVHIPQSLLLRKKIENSDQNVINENIQWFSNHRAVWTKEHITAPGSIYTTFYGSLKCTFIESS